MPFVLGEFAIAGPFAKEWSASVIKKQDFRMLPQRSVVHVYDDIAMVSHRHFAPVDDAWADNLETAGDPWVGMGSECRIEDYG